MGWLTARQIKDLGFAKVGKQVLLSDKASYYRCSNIQVGDYSRIDDFCILSAGSGGISIGRNVHISVFTLLIGAEKILISDFVSLSSRVSVYSSNDDYMGNAMTNPTVPNKFTNVTHAPVIIKRHAIIGSGSVILPGVVIEQGAAVGALSLVNKNCDAFTIYAGIPVKRLRLRQRNLLEFEKVLMGEEEPFTG